MRGAVAAAAVPKRLNTVVLFAAAAAVAGDSEANYFAPALEFSFSPFYHLLLLLNTVCTII